jgi:hypothetical protein
MSHSKLHAEHKQQDQKDPVNLTATERVTVQDKVEKVKVTLYISPDVHRKLKIVSAVTAVSMSSIVEQSINSYLEHLEREDMGEANQLHNCPECAHPLVFRAGKLSAVSPNPTVVGESLLSSEEGFILR